MKTTRWHLGSARLEWLSSIGCALLLLLGVSASSTFAGTAKAATDGFSSTKKLHRAGVRDLDANRRRGVSQAYVVAIEALEVISKAHGARQVKGVERAKLDRVQLGSRVEGPRV